MRSLALAAALAGLSAGALARGPERDDPRARIEARNRQDGLLSPAQLKAIQGTAQRELLRASALAPKFRSTSVVTTPITPGAIVNVGPAGATYETNGATYPDVDSGRAAAIVAHPTDPNIVYLATAGGGAWKTFDARAAQPHWTSITDGLAALGTGTLALDPNAPDSLFLGLGDPFDIPMPGIYTSADGGATWTGPVYLVDSGSGNVASSVREARYSPANTGTVIVATDIGLFRNTNHGTGDETSWSLATLPMPVPGSPTDCWSVGAVGGTTWVATCTDDDGNAGAWGTGSVYRSTDDGASWSLVSVPQVNLGQGALNPGRMSIAVALGNTPVASTRVYIEASDVTGYATLDVYKSADGGATFTGLGVNATGAPTNPTPGSPSGGSGDQTDLDVMHDQAWYNQAIFAVAGASSAQDTIFAGGNLNMIRSTTGGSSWSVVTDWLPYDVSGGGVTYNYLGIPYVHADYHAMGVSAAGGTPLFFAGTDGGIFRSYDVFTALPGASASGPGGVVSPTFDDAMNNGLSTHLLYHVCAQTTSTAAPILGGMQDNGSRLRNASEPTMFDQVTGGDGIGCGMGKAAGTGAFGSLLITTYPSWVSRSIDGGATFNDAVTGLPAQCTQSTPAGTFCMDGGGNFLMQISADPNDGTAQTFLTPIKSAFSSTLGNYPSRVYRTTNGAASWNDITGTVAGTAGQFPKSLLGVSAHPKSANKYVAWSAGRIFVTTNAGSSSLWSMNTTPLAQSPISSAAFDPNDSTGATVWISVHQGPNASSANPGHVFKVTAANTGSPTFTNASGDLPDVPATVIVVDPRDATSNTIYVGTDIGLYGTTNGGTNWTRYGTNLPAVKVTDLALATDGSSLRIATYGRGYWEMYPSATAPASMLANGDHDGNQVIDGVDLVMQAAALDVNVTSPSYDPKSNLTGSTNAIDWSDMLALFVKFGGRP